MPDEDILSAFADDQADAGSTVATSIDDQPDKVVRAMELGQGFGVSPAVVYSDLDNFDRNAKIRLASNVVRSNPHLTDYVMSNAMAAKLSQDDFAQLDAVSEKVTNYGQKSILGAAAEGFKSGFDFEGLQHEYSALYNYIDHPLWKAAVQDFGVGNVAMGLEASTRGFTGLLYGGAAGIAETAKRFGVSEAWADRLTRDIIQGGQVALSGQHLIRAPIAGELQQAARAARSAAPYLKDGKEPPVGLDPVIDQVKAQQSKADLDALNDALKEATKSATRERSPEMFADFIRQHNPGDIYVSADAVRKLYGDKVPRPDDGLLGWVPGLERQLASAEAIGGDVTIPAADWLAKVEPDVAKELNNHIRTREGNVTTEEAKTLPEKASEPVPGASVVEDIRRAHTLDPMEDVILQAEDIKDKQGAFSIRDKSGADLGTIYLAEEADGKRIYIDSIEAAGGPGTLGQGAIKSLLQQIKERYPNAESVEGMRVSGAREAKEAFGNIKFDLAKVKPKQPKQLELPQAGTTRIEDRALFDKASAIGMTVEQYKRYQKLIEKRREEDAQASQKRALEDAKRRQTAEWKARETEIRPEVVEAVNARPDVAVDKFLREGVYDNNPLESKPRLAAGLLTEEQKAALPKEFISEQGMHPGDVATLFGFPDVDTMISRLSGYLEEQKTSGLKGERYRRLLINLETERRMQGRFGDLSKAIIDDAMDHVLSETQLDLLHEEVVGLASKADAELTIKKDALKSWIKDQFEDSPLRSIKADKLLADAGKAGKEAEMGLLRGDFKEAFKQKQRQFLAVTMAQEARKLEKAKASLEKVAKRFSKREVSGVEQGAVNYVQQLLSQAGFDVKLSPKEIQEAIDFQGHGTLEQWTQDKASMGWEPVVSEDILISSLAGTSGNGPLRAKPLAQMTVGEFRDFKDAIDSLVHIGSQEKQIEIMGEKLDHAEFVSRVRANLEALPARARESQGRWLYQIDASLTRMEEIIKDLDLRQELGPLFSAIIEPMMASKAKSFDMLQELSNHFRKVRGDFGRTWMKSLNDTIPNDFLIDPYTKAPYDLSRENMIQIMLNWGNRSNIEKFTRGYASVELGRIATKEEGAAFEQRVKALIDTHAKPEDWKFVQAMWEPFKKWQKDMDVVARNTSGVAPKWIDPERVITPHGPFEGGYWPVKYDRLASNISVIEDKARQDSLFGPNYFRAATSKSHLRERTGYVDFIDINSSLEQAAGVMQQTIHDIAFRDSVIQASKVFYDKSIRGLVRKHYGSEYEDQMIPWLKRIANKNTVDDRSIKGWNSWMRRVRINLVGHALPLNLKVILSPDVGVPNPAAWTSFEANRADNVKLAMEKSNEIRHMVYNMDRDFREHLDRVTTKKGWSSYQSQAAQWGFGPVMKFSQEFRMSTFVDQFNRAKGRGLTDHEASVVADSFVRERHGAASIVDLPAVMESNEAMKAMTMFYGYFNTMYNWQRQMPGQVRRGEYSGLAVNALGTLAVGAFFNGILFNRAKEGESWFSHIAKAIISQPLSTVPVLRDAVALFMEGQEGRTPAASLWLATRAMFNDAYNATHGKRIEKPITHAGNVVGLTTGLPLAQVGRSSQFVYDVATNRQRPKNIIEWMKGLIHGEINRKR
jgi:hypothetical protein